MNKKSVKYIVVCMLVVLVCAVLVACDNNSDGKDGLSAYELACRQGFDGTLDEWLASLKGEDGSDGTNGADGKDGETDVNALYAFAKQNGFSGTYSDFLKEYLTMEADNSAAANEALLSSVKVVCSFTYKVSSWSGTTEKSGSSSGSGVIYKLNKQTGDAYIVTNYHVVYEPSAINSTDGIIDDISVYLYGSDLPDAAISAKFLGGSSTYDIAVLKVEGSEMLKQSSSRAVRVRNSDDLVVGSTALAVGNAAGLGISVTQGVISVDSEVITVKDASNNTSSHRVVRVDAAINSGNSGGGLFNADGELIGIVNAKTSSTSIENMGYAIPSNIAISVADRIISDCDGENVKSVKKYTLGIELTASSSKAVYDSDKGVTRIVETVTVSGVGETSASKDVLLVGDIIKSVTIGSDKFDIERSFALADYMWRVNAGDRITFEIVRGEQTKVVSINSADEAHFASVA